MNDPRPTAAAPAEAPAEMTPERARRLLDALQVPLAPGLSDVETAAVEERFGFRFAPDHRTLVQAGLPLGRYWPDWRHGRAEELRARLDEPRRGVLSSVAGGGFWYRGWGLRPEDGREARAVAEARLREVPQLVPVFSHRYLPGIAGCAGLPVLSVHGTDIICYGEDLAAYLNREFGVPADGLRASAARVPFWSHFLNVSYLTAEDLASTPVDPYAVDADEAVEHLRMLAVEQRLGRRVEAGQLVEGALTAVALGVDTPAVAALAELPPRAWPQASVLFARAVGELGLVLPDDPVVARRALVGWWVRLVADGVMNAHHGGVLVWHEGWEALGRPEALRPLVDATAAYEDGDGVRTEPRAEPRGVLTARIVTEARRLADGPWLRP